MGRCVIADQQKLLESQLNSFDWAKRMEALAELQDMWVCGKVSVSPERDIVNMHCHTFFSFNGYGHSPASLAWLARREGYRAIGIVDFDVLDAVDEFLLACDKLAVRGTAGIETRVYVPEFATRVINSPGEPGVFYDMGIGFVTGGVSDPEAAGTLADMRARAERRNREMLARLNAHLAPVALDYERDVLPLTPKGNATERHMLAAIIAQVRRSVADEIAYWAEKLSLPTEKVSQTLADGAGGARFADVVRSRLMKRGGVGYVQPGPDSFPTVETFHGMITACEALPCFTWLDGTSDGEQCIEELLDLMIGKGAATLNIVPDRNWNISDPEVRALKVRKLHEIVRLAEARDLPLNVGTEMNAYGQKLVDDFDAPEMEPLRAAFIGGAMFVYGHTLMQQALTHGYASSWAAEHFPTRRQRNAFYTEIGRRAEPGRQSLARLRQLGVDLAPAAYLQGIAG